MGKYRISIQTICRRVVFCLAAFLFTFYMDSAICLAGDIPETLLLHDYPVYFGEVKSMDDEGITIRQVQNIKGDFILDREITYPDFAFTESPIVGNTYLCGYVDENNPLYIWEVDCYDTATLTIANADNMSKRMQQYLNEGAFEKSEEVLGLMEMTGETVNNISEADNANNNQDVNYLHTTVIGGADGPTAIFLAGKFNSKLTIALVCAGVLAIVGFVVVLIKWLRK